MDQFDVENLIEEKYKNIKGERQIMAYIIRRDNSFATRLNEKVFTLDAFRTAFKLAIDSGKTMTKEVFQRKFNSYLGDDEKHLLGPYTEKIFKTRLKEINSKVAQSIVEDLSELYETRETLSLVSDIGSNLANFDLKKTKNRFKELLVLGSSTTSVSSGDFLEDFDQRLRIIREIQQNPDAYVGIPTGIKKFDEISGGIQNGELAILLAQTGKGKSMALGNFGMNAWFQQKNVVMITLEMTKLQLQNRLDARISQISHGKFRNATLSKLELKEWKRKIEELRESIKSYYEIIHIPRGANCSHIEQEVLRVQDKRKGQCQLLLVDYMNLLNSVKPMRGGGLKDWSSQSEAAYDLKGLASDLNGCGVPTWTANQVTDDFDPDKKNSKMKTSNMKYARGISEVAQIICGLSQSVDQHLEGWMKFEVVKCRDFKKPDYIKIFPDHDIMVLDRERHSLEDIM